MAPETERSGIDEAVDAFLTHASVERGLSPRTVEAYGRDLAHFAAFLASARVKSLSAVQRKHVI